MQACCVEKKTEFIIGSVIAGSHKSSSIIIIYFENSSVRVVCKTYTRKHTTFWDKIIIRIDGMIIIVCIYPNHRNLIHTYGNRTGNRVFADRAIIGIARSQRICIARAVYI